MALVWTTGLGDPRSTPTTLKGGALDARRQAIIYSKLHLEESTGMVGHGRVLTFRTQVVSHHVVQCSSCAME